MSPMCRIFVVSAFIVKYTGVMVSNADVALAMGSMIVFKRESEIPVHEFWPDAIYTPFVPLGPCAMENENPESGPEICQKPPPVFDNRIDERFPLTPFVPPAPDTINVGTLVVVVIRPCPATSSL